MALRDCSGTTLPEAQLVDCSEPVDHFGDCCVEVQILDEVLLNERLESKKGTSYYWLWLRADETSLVVCALEQYANQRADWKGRRADYLAVGWYDGDCYIAVIELRRTLVKEDHALKKLEQVEETIKQVVSSLLPEFITSDVFASACDQPQQVKIIGVVIPTEHSKKRAEKTRVVSVGDYKALIVALPHSRLKQCGIGWNELLMAVGL